MFKINSLQMTQHFSLAELIAYNREKMFQWVIQICNPDTRENAIRELSARREYIYDLGPIIWHTTGTIASLLFEIVVSYPYVNPQTMSLQQMNRLCHVIHLLQCVGAHQDTRLELIKAEIPLYIFPFLYNENHCPYIEHLRFTSLGVIDVLVMTEEQEVIGYLLSIDIIPMCLSIMENGFELTKTRSTSIFQKILMTDIGLNYICQTYRRFSHVALILGNMVLELENEPSTKLLRNIVGCYVRLSQNSRAREALTLCLPDRLRDMAAFSRYIITDHTIAIWLVLLKKNLDCVKPINISPDIPSLSLP